MTPGELTSAEKDLLSIAARVLGAHRLLIEYPQLAMRITNFNGKMDEELVSIPSYMVSRY